MGIKKFFKVKPPTEQEVESSMRERMMDKGLMVKHESKNKPSTFSAYAEYANDKFKAKREYAPAGYSRKEKEESERERSGNGNPYSQGSLGDPSSSSSSTNPYATIGSSSATNSNPYASSSINSQPNSNSNPYASQSSAADAHPSYGSGSSGYNSTSGNTGQPSSRVSNPYNQKRSANPYASQRSGSFREDEDVQQEQQPQGGFTFEPALEKTSTNMSSRTQRTQGYGGYQQQLLEEDLNDTGYADEDLNDEGYIYEEGYVHDQAPPEYQQQVVHEETEEERLQREEDEDVEKIKGDIRFTKQESVASTRNTLRMAREAEESGKNTMGILGAQAETLYNTERNLQLAEAQDKLAKEKVAELHHYNRHILKPSVKNPFTAKSRLRRQEEKLKNDRIAYKAEQQRARSELNSSTQRAKSAIDDADGMGETVAAKYRREKIREEAKRYQFEADSEDDEMEQELGENLDEIGRIAGRLKTLAMTQGQEIDRQNMSLRNIEEQADRLDVNLHVNTASLNRAR